ncbi:MAG: 2Fe-2S iron-sulfur cluster binding domain-containing protein [Planctomycetales bacterium]|nr:2Fe-2S iron-sulfur cluster binding domain-containing protein [Planctomycetales bacterium]
MPLDAPTLGLLSGAALAGAAGLRAAGGAAKLWLRDKNADATTERRRERFADKLDAALVWARASNPSLKAWVGTRPFRVSAVVDESGDCRSYYLVPEDGRPLPRFAPGQYLTFHLPVAAEQPPVVRCYSLSDRPRDDYYRVTVRRVPAPTDRPDLPLGQGSHYFHHEVHAGSRLDVEAPQGAFFLDPTDDAAIVLIGAGIGITPVLSMAGALAYARDPRPIYLVAGFRNSREHPFRTRLADLAEATPNLHLHTVYSRPLPVDRRGRDFDSLGRIDVARLQQVLPANNFRYYLCGPGPLMESLVPALLDWGVPGEHIHYEAFGPASVRGLGALAESEPCDVQFARSGHTLRWEGAEGSLLALAEQGGVRLDSGCRAGSCGQCRVGVLAGKVQHAKQPGVELAEGECLACIAQPAGDVTLDA